MVIEVVVASQTKHNKREQRFAAQVGVVMVIPVIFIYGTKDKAQLPALRISRYLI